MPLLADAQANFIATINDGPDQLDPSIFAGDAQRVFLGLKAHANTISHARLVALEETFPRCRAAMGDEDFNRASREYCDTANARASSIDNLGAAFIPHIVNGGISAQLCDLAKIEWSWLQSYNAAEGEVLELADLAGLSEEALLELNISVHPACEIVPLSDDLSPELNELEDAGAAHSILITRPQAQPILTPVDGLTSQLFEKIDSTAEKTTTIGNLLHHAAEQVEEADALACIITLINAGALQGRKV